MTFLIFGCRKSSDSSAGLNSVCGIYTGKLQYHYQAPGSSPGTTYTYDTTVDNDTIFIMKRTSNSFCCYRPSAEYTPSYYGPNLMSCWDYDPRNSYYGSYFSLTFFPVNDKLEYNESNSLSSGFGHTDISTRFAGKKIK